MSPEQYKKLRQESNAKLSKLEASRTKNKYSSKGQYYKGEYYHSTGEKNYAEQLDIRILAGEIVKWERQKKIELKVNGATIANYYMDFIVTHNDGSKELIEYKGLITKDFQLKWNLLHALKDELFPEGVVITMVKHESKYKPKSTWKRQSKK